MHAMQDWHPRAFAYVLMRQTVMRYFARYANTDAGRTVSDCAALRGSQCADAMATHGVTDGQVRSAIDALVDEGHLFSTIAMNTSRPPSRKTSGEVSGGWGVCSPRSALQARRPHERALCIRANRGPCFRLLGAKDHGGCAGRGDGAHDEQRGARRLSLRCRSPALPLSCSKSWRKARSTKWRLYCGGWATT